VKKQPTLLKLKQLIVTIRTKNVSSISELIPHHNAVSGFLQFFGFKPADNQARDDTICRHCHLKAAGGNTNLKSYLQKRHAGELERLRKIVEKSQPTAMAKAVVKHSCESAATLKARTLRTCF